MPGVIGHLRNPTVGDVEALAARAEAAGARWLGLADAFWWRDVWILLAAAAAATHRIALGPAMTNPYLRHPFVTIAALATLQEVAGPRIFLGLAAGGSEAMIAANVDRRDAPARAVTLIRLLRAVAGGQPFDAESGRGLDVPLGPVPVLVAGGRDGMVRVGGEHADQVLLWAKGPTELSRIQGLVREAASGRTDGGPDLVWAPLAVVPGDPNVDLDDVAVYAVLNASPALLARWGLSTGNQALIRRAVVAGDLSRAVALLPAGVLEELVLRGPDAEPSVVAERARATGVTSIAVPVFSVDGVEARVAWATDVEAALCR